MTELPGLSPRMQVYHVARDITYTAHSGKPIALDNLKQAFRSFSKSATCPH